MIGLKCSDGILLGVEKLVQTKLLVPGSNKRIFTVDYHAGIASAGLIADGKHLAGRAREEAINFRDTYRYRSPIKVRRVSCLTDPCVDCLADQISSQALTERLALYVQAYTLYSSVRPFGISSVLGGVDEDGPQLYMIEPSGVYWGYNGCAIGKGRQLAKTEIEKLSLGKEGMTVKNAVQHAANM